MRDENYNGYVLFDLYFYAGYSSDRFVSLYFSNFTGKTDRNSALIECLKPDDSILEMAEGLLEEYFDKAFSRTAY